MQNFNPINLTDCTYNKIYPVNLKKMRLQQRKIWKNPSVRRFLVFSPARGNLASLLLSLLLLPRISFWFGVPWNHQSLFPSSFFPSQVSAVCKLSTIYLVASPLPAFLTAHKVIKLVLPYVLQKVHYMNHSSRYHVTKQAGSF